MPLPLLWWATPTWPRSPVEVRSRDARAVQAGLWPNPRILVELENLGGTGDRAAFEQAETTVWLSQLIPIAGKRAKQRTVAELERDVSDWAYRGRRLSILTDTTKAFISTLAAQRRVELLEELEQLAEDSRNAVRSLARAGGASMVDQTRAEVESSNVRLRRQRAEGELAASRASLAASWGSMTPEFTAVRGDLERILPPPALARLEPGVYDNPDVARWVTELERRSAALELARARRLPDPTISLGGRHFNDSGDSALVFSFSLPLPVFDRNQGSVLAAARDLSKTRAERASAELSVRTVLRRRHADLVASYEQAVTLRRETLPAAEKTFTGARRGHSQGFLRALDVIDAQRTLFELQAQYLSVLASYHLARADIERLTATSFDDAATGDVP